MTIELRGLLGAARRPPGEDRRPHPAFWTAPYVSSRLAQYEVPVTLHDPNAPATAHSAAERLFAGMNWVELVPAALARAQEPFPRGAVVRTLDALHLATADALRAASLDIEIATYDRRMAAAARAMGLTLADL